MMTLVTTKAAPPPKPLFDPRTYGAATTGPISGLRILNNTVLSAQYGGLCIESVDGSSVSDVLVRGLDLTNTGRQGSSRCLIEERGFKPLLLITPKPTNLYARQYNVTASPTPAHGSPPKMPRPKPPRA